MPLNEAPGLDVFQDMEHLPERLELFARHLQGVPCELPTIGDSIATDCSFQSRISRMCPVCQIKMFFVHTVLNWDAYHPNPEGFVGSFTE